MDARWRRWRDEERGEIAAASAGETAADCDAEEPAAAVLRARAAGGGFVEAGREIDCGGGGGRVGALDADRAAGVVARAVRACDGAGGVEAVNIGERGTGAG